MNYTATDARGLIGAATRTVHLVDTVAPLIYAPDLTLELLAPTGNWVGGYAPLITDADTLSKSPSRPIIRSMPPPSAPHRIRTAGPPSTRR